MSILLRGATVEDLAGLSELAMRSKAYWGYDDAFMEACRAELTVSEDRLHTEVIIVADESTGLGPIGYFALRVAPPASELMDLFVDPVWIGRGIGSLLWSRIVPAATTAGARWIDIEADPNAADWYERQGAQRVGTVPSLSIPGRQIPQLRVDVSNRTPISGRPSERGR
jgi:GNAT superfamily N-acetyltransferase